MFYKELGINPLKRYMISFTGGGGKTSHMFQLAKELKNFGNVLVTTTTKILLPEEKAYDYLTILENHKLEVHKTGITLLAQKISKEKKISGVDKNLLDDLYKEGIFQFILIEADGAKKKPLKAPNETEPLIPLNTNINIGIIGVDALDKKVSDVCFRENLFENITGKNKVDIVDNKSILDLINHENGLFKNTPRKCKRFLIISKCDDSVKQERARILLDKVLGCKDIDMVFLSSIYKRFISKVFIDVCGIIMASGLSRRMGENKLLMEVENEAMIEKVVKECNSSHLKDLIIVYNKDNVKEKVESYNIKCVYNNSPEIGQSMSIKLGIKEASAISPKGYMFFVGDQPFIKSELINALLIKFKTNDDNIIIPNYKGENGNPVIFPNNLKYKFDSLKNDSGGREIIKDYNKIIKLEVENYIQGFDIDTKEDYHYMKKIIVDKS